MSAYLTDAQARGQGVKAAAAPDLVLAASAVIDGYLKRPEGLIYVADASGAPCYMAGLQPTASLALSTPIAPGIGVQAVVTGWVTPALLGEVLIADRSDPNKVEALTITGVSGQTLTFDRAARAHSGLLEAGLTIVEDRTLPGRPVTQLSRAPVARLLSGLGRYSYGRRSDRFSGQADYGLVSALQSFSGTPVWQAFNVHDVSVGPNGEVWIPPGLYMANFSEVRLRYVAGFAAVPAPVQSACAAIVGTLSTFPELTGNLKRIEAGGTKLERFADQALDADTRNLLTPYAARLFA